MLDTLTSQLGFAVVVVVAAFAFLKGDEPERIGAGAYLLGAFATVLLQDRTALHGLQWPVFAIDGVFLAVCAALAWKSRRSWPVWACGFQTLAVLTHVLIMVDLRPPLWAFYVVLNLATLGVLASIAVGTAIAWRDRRAAGLG